MYLGLLYYINELGEDLICSITDVTPTPGYEAEYLDLRIEPDYKAMKDRAYTSDISDISDDPILCVTLEDFRIHFGHLTENADYNSIIGKKVIISYEVTYYDLNEPKVLINYVKEM